ncbi:MAG: hypothetical protein M2R45_04429 [Verrucomicrobia subdivision 3 bacterium]|nr:hypothetical protein [Limisphaerales bacterium]MCS1413517.1 hypothetical protein [Limisphaerales bacterium]
MLGDPSRFVKGRLLPCSGFSGNAVLKAAVRRSRIANKWLRAPFHAFSSRPLAAIRKKSEPASQIRFQVKANCQTNRAYCNLCRVDLMALKFGKSFGVGVCSEY